MVVGDRKKKVMSPIVKKEVVKGKGKEVAVVDVPVDGSPRRSG